MQPLSKRMLFAFAATIGLLQPTFAAPQYFVYPGAGTSFAWDSANWSANADGSGGLSGWMSGSDAVFWSSNSTPPPSVTISPGTPPGITANSITVNLSGEVFLPHAAGVNLTVSSGVFDVQNGLLSVSSDWGPWGVTITGGNDLTKNGAGILRFLGYGTHNYTGDTVVNGGSLIVQDNGSLTAGTKLEIASGATFQIQTNDVPAFTMQTFGGVSGSGFFNVNTNYASSKVTIDVGTGESYDFSGQINFSSTTSSDYFVKSGAGTQTLSGADSNVYSGNTTVTAGTLLLSKSGGATALGGNVTIQASGTVGLGASDQIADAGNLILEGGRLELGVSSETLATLVLNSSSAISITGGGLDRLVFADSSAVSWDGGSVLTIYGLVHTNSIRFGIDANGLTGTQLSQIVFDAYDSEPTLIDGSGYIYTASMVPEPTACAMAAFGLTMAVIFGRRRRVSMA